MALNDKTQRVVLKFNVDAQGVVLGVQRIGDELTKVEKKAKDTGKGLGDFIGGIDSTVEKLKRGLGDVSAFIGIANDLFKHSLEESRLQMGASGVSIEGLRKASRGLKTEMDLLRDAVKFKSAAEKLSQRDMEDVERAMDSLTRKGKDAQKVNEAINQALTKLSTEGLQELGIRVDKAGLSMDDASDRAELFKRVMQQLRDESLGVADAELTKEERTASAGVTFTNAVDRMKTALGEFVTALAPMIEKVAWLIENVPKLVSGIGTGMGKLYKGWAQSMGLNVWHDDSDGTQGVNDILQARLRRNARVRELFAQGNTIGAGMLGSGGAEELDETSGTAAVAGWLKQNGWAPGGIDAPVGAKYKGKGQRDAAASAALAEAKRAAEEAKRLANEVAKSLTDDLVKQLEDEAPDIEDAFEALGSNLTEMLGNLDEKIASGITAMGDADKKRKNFLEAAFGPIEEFNQYAAAFNILGSAVTSAMDAWITGSESMGTAIKKALAQGIKALASELAMNALKHGAYALGSLAFGDVRGAAMHGAAAGKFALGAVAAAAVARSMGHGGTDYGSAGTPTGAGGAAPRPTSGGASQSGGGSHTVMIIGDPHDTETNSRRRTANAKRIISRVVGDSAGGSF